MPRKYYDYYGGDVETNPYGEAVGRGISSGIERALNRKEKMKDVETTLASQGYRVETPEDAQDADAPRINLYDKKYIKPSRPEQIAERAFKQKEREYKTKEMERKPFDIRDFLGNGAPGGIDLSKMDQSVELDSEGKAKIKYTPKDVIKEQKYEDAKVKEKDRQKRANDMVHTSAMDTMRNIREVKKGLKYFGMSGIIPSTPGTAMRTWKLNLNMLLAGKILEVMNTMKQASRTGATGFGQLSDKERVLLENAATTLKPTLPEDKALEILNLMEDKLNKVLYDTSEVPGGMGVAGGEPAEEDIAYTMQQHPEFSREQILQMLRR